MGDVPDIGSSLPSIVFEIDEKYRFYSKPAGTPKVRRTANILNIAIILIYTQMNIELT